VSGPRDPSAAAPRLDFQPIQRLLYGPGRLAELGDLARGLGFRRCLLVTDPGIVRAGHVDLALASLSRAGIDAVTFSEVEENPTTLHVEKALEAARAHRIDSIVGLGGGSAMDCSKGANFLFSNGGRMQDYWGIGKADKPMLPAIGIPTTAGTGSEAQSFALISDPATHQKMACGDVKAAFRAAILDPQVTLSMPFEVTAATGMDAISHALESFVTTRRNPISRAFSREAWRLLAGNFEAVLESPSDLDARAAMLLGASLAGMAIENSMLGAAHALANPLTAHHDVAHGRAIGLLLPHVVRYNSGACAGDYQELVALAAGGDGARSGAERVAALVERLRRRARLPERLSDCGVPEAELPALAEEAARQWTAQFNPRPVTFKDLEEIYRCAF
jgi:alcohol dehydrogenase